jgi:arylsulfatase A-like enzyme
VKNVLLLTIDTLRRDVLGCYGNDEGLTPFIDSILEKCTVFTKAHSIAPYTQASFPGILTSSYMYDYPRAQQLSAKRTLISEVLTKADIATAGFHSNPYLCGFFGWNRGWDHYYDSMQDEVSPMCPYISGDIINQKADSWLGSHITGGDYKPFFLWAHYMDVHEPYVPEQKHIDQIDPSIKMSKEEMFKLFKDVVLPRDASDPKIVDLLRKLYKAHVIQVDEYTKGLFSVLEKHNVLEDTTVIITTDHGDEFNDHGSLSHDGRMFSELVHIPFLVYNHGSDAGPTCDTVVSGVDTSPTVVSLFGLEPEANFQGQSVLPVDGYQSKGSFGEAVGKLSHKIKETDRPVYFYRENDIKVIYRVEEDSWEMYDIAVDPGETKNIIDSSDKADEFKAKLQPRINREPKE